MTPARPSWDEVWMAVADEIAKRSSCDGRQVGAVIVDSHDRVVSSGYNGPPAGFPRDQGTSCGSWCARQQARTDGEELPDPGGRGTGAPAAYGLSCPTVHAEANALLFADRRDYEGGTIYATAACCADCGKLIANSGVSRAVIRVDSRDSHRNPQDTIEFLRTCGLTVEVWND